jgi:protein subunit release factor A
MRLDRDDVEVEFVRGSGPGGQHRNKSFTGVRVRHRPTGLVATATERRSRAQNLAVALKRLAARVEVRLRPVTPRVATRPTRAAGRRRLEAKRRQGERKRLRRGPRADE